MAELVSRHFLKRRAIARAAAERRADPLHHYKWMPTGRRTYRWKVVRVAKPRAAVSL